MSNRRAFLIWISVSIVSGRSFRFVLPIPLLLLLGVSDFLEDAAFFVPSSNRILGGGKISPGSVKRILIASAGFLREIALRTEPFELADIDVSDGNRRFAVRCLLK